MKLEKGLSLFFKLNDKTWMQHANPWSFWTRFIISPFLALAIWSRVWIGLYSLVPIILLLVWTWVNPRAFPKPKTTKHWSSKGVLGERVWIARKEIPIPKHHATTVNILNVVTASGIPFLVWGLYDLHIWSTILGLTLIYLGKMWFIDRMVWLYEDMKGKSEEYASWEY